jgi:hypothetical protein
MLGARPACSPDPLQGLPKKIEVDLLLADLAFQLGNPLARLLDLAWRLFRRRLLLALLWTPFAAQRFRAAGSKTSAPIIQVLAQNLQLPRSAATFSPAIIRRTAASLNPRLKTRDLFLGIQFSP